MAFNDIIGQELPKKILCSQLRDHRIATSYLFYGPEGVGKTLTAKTFAKAINCETSINDCCDGCQTCLEIENSRNPDFLLITSDTSIGIDQIRELKARNSYKPTWLKTRITVIKGADKLTEQAANAFLKILEEPSPKTTFILTTSKITSILPTIRSRCQPIKFRRLRTQEIEKFLHNTAPSQANGSITRALFLLSPEAKEIKDLATQFFHGSPLQRIQMIEKLHQLDLKELLLSLQKLYMDSLRTTLTEKLLNAITTCERAFRASSQNVHKKLILYWLSKELPPVNWDLPA